jgi:acyl carrier protein
MFPVEINKPTIRASENGNSDVRAQLTVPETYTAETIEVWLVSKIAAELHVEASQVERNQEFTRFGLDSITVFSLTGDLADWLELDLPATLFWEYPTIESLARYLADNLSVED